MFSSVGSERSDAYMDWIGGRCLCSSLIIRGLSTVRVACFGNGTICCCIGSGPGY